MSQADTLVEQGMKLYSAGRAAESDALFRQALEMQPTHKMALYMLGNARNAQGDFAQGIALLQRAAETHPDFAEAHYSLGVAYGTQQKLELAARAMQRAMIARPNFVEASVAYGALCYRLGRMVEAETTLRNVVRVNPNAVEAQWYLGVVFEALGRPKEATERFQAAAALVPDDLTGWEYLGLLAEHTSRHEQAISYLTRVIEQAPQNGQAKLKLAAAYAALERFAEAETLARAALALQPDEGSVHSALGHLLYKQGKMREAQPHQERAVQLRPDQPILFYNLWNILMLQGDFKPGWEAYEAWMQASAHNARVFQQPRWDGSAQSGKTLLVYADHGFGDAIQFARYLPLVKQRFQGRVVLECQPPLQRLFQSIKSVDSIVPRAPDLKPPAISFDFRIGLMSLAGLFETTVETVPADVPYLRPPADLILRWGERLPTAPAFTIGICWTGDPGNQWNPIRSCRLQDFAPLAQIPGLCFVSLQVGSGAKQAATPPKGMRLLDLSSKITDFADTAALMQNLDLIITIETSVAHLAGALGLPTWTLLPFVPDWRWLMEREDTPWYPTMRLFRQPHHGDWKSVFERLTTELKTLRHSDRI